MDDFQTDSASVHDCPQSRTSAGDALNAPALSKDVLSKLLDGCETDIEWPIHLLVTDAAFVPGASDAIFYRLWLSDGCCSTAGGLVTYDLFWASKIVKDELFDPDEWPVIRVRKLHCYGLRSANKPVFELVEFEVAGWVEATTQSTTNLDDWFTNEPLSGDESDEEEVKLEDKIAAPLAPATQSQPPCTAAFLDEDDAFDELEMMDLELAAMGRARGRLVLLSPPVWEQGGTHHNVRFTCVDDKTVSGRVLTPLLSYLPPINTACVLHVRPPATDLLMTRAHLGAATDSSQLSPVQFKPIPLAKVRRLKGHASCDVVGVVTRGPCRKDFGINHEEKKFVIFIVDQSSRFELPIEMWPSASKQLTDLPENAIVAIFNARRSSLNMSCLYLRYDSMILVQPEWLEEVKQMQAWWLTRSEAPLVSSLLKLMDDAKEGVVSEGMVSWLRIVDVAEGLRCDIRCPNCSLKAYDLAQVSFVCTECGPIHSVQVLEISTELRLNDRNADYWATLEKDAFKTLLNLPEKVFASVDSPHTYAKVIELKGKELRARIKYFKDGKQKFVIMEAEMLPEEKDFPDLNQL